MENPWGEPSPPLASASAAAPSSSTANRDSTESHASDLDDDAKRAPRLSLELVDEDDDAPAWDAHDDSPDGLDDDADDAWAHEARASMRKVNDLVLSDQATEGEQARDAAGLATSLHNGDEEEEETTQVAEPPAAPAPPIPIVPPALPDFDIDAGQQMDDFPEDDHDDETKDGGGDDDFDEFGDAAGAGDQGDDDFGDFGDFGVAAPLDEAAFEAAPATTTTTPLPSTSLASTSPFSSHQQQPFASTSAAATLSYPPLHFDLSGDPSRQSISSQLHDFWQGAFPAAANAVSDEPERQVEGVAQVLVSESSRSLWSELSTLPPLRPVDWRRSRIRREHLISMGFPVSQEEEAPLPSMTAQTSPNPAFSVPARPSSAPPPASSAALSSSQNGLGRPSTPLGTTTTTARGGGTTTSSSVNRSLGPAGLAPAQPPPFDRERAEQALAAADLSLRSLDELRQLDAELDRISVDASELLTHALMMREKETQDKEVYNGMIQDLVIAAAKMKTSSAISSGAGKEPKRSGSGRWKLSK